jgi:hypothetical protein
MKTLILLVSLFSFSTHAISPKDCEDAYWDKAKKRSTSNKVVAGIIVGSGVAVGTILTGGATAAVYGGLWGATAAGGYIGAQTLSDRTDKSIRYNNYHVIRDLMRASEMLEEGLRIYSYSREDDALADLAKKLERKLSKCSFVTEIDNRLLKEAIQSTRSQYCQIKANGKITVANYFKVRRLISNYLVNRYNEEQCL